MGNLGSNIKCGGLIPAEHLADLGLTWVRVVATRTADERTYFEKLASVGIDIWLVLARESFDGFGPMRPDGQPSDEALRRAMDEYRERYGGLISVVEAGNEPDGEPDSSSWVQSRSDFERLLWRARDRFGSGQFIVAGGLVSGWPEWMSDIENLEPPGLDWVNGIAVHPYGQAPGEPFEFDPSGYFGRVTDLLQSYRSWLNAAGRTDKTIHVSEWGAPAWDFEEDAAERHFTDMHEYLRATHKRAEEERRCPTRFSDDTLDRQAKYIANMAHTLLALNHSDTMQFCYTDAMVPGFGLTDVSLDPRPAFHALRAVIQETEPIRTVSSEHRGRLGRVRPVTR